MLAGESFATMSGGFGVQKLDELKWELAWSDTEQSDAFKSCTRRMEKVGGGAVRETFLCGTGWVSAGCSVSS